MTLFEQDHVNGDILSFPMIWSLYPSIAGQAIPSAFGPFRLAETIDDMYRFSSGVARLINKVATHCLMYGAQNGHRIIDDRMVKRVIEGELS